MNIWKLRHFTIIVLILIWIAFISSSSVYVLDTTSYKKTNIIIQKTDKRLFNATKNTHTALVQRMKDSFNITCTWNVQFACKENWSTTDKFWCWFERTSKSLGNRDVAQCILEPKVSGIIWLVINFKTVPYYKNYPLNFDITDNFPYKRLQLKELSCESSATADIISAIKGIKITEDDIIEKLPKTDFYNKKAIVSWKKIIWWDPNVWFVWYMDKYEWHGALQYKYEWYGVYEQPIQNVYEQYWISTSKINKYDYHNLWINKYEHLKLLLVALNEGKFIQLWADTCTYKAFEDWKLKNINQSLVDQWFNGINYCVYPTKGRIITWYVTQTDWTLKQINWLNGEHAFYLMWYKWGIENPTNIIVWDTHTWRHEYKTEEWMRKWWKMEFRSIITK